MPSRCPVAVHAGIRLCSRCLLVAGHGGQHLARGPERFPAQRIHWPDGDKRSFFSERTDDYAWDLTPEEMDLTWPPATT